MNFDIDALIDARNFQSPIDISGVDPTSLIEAIRMMTLIRRCEERIGDMVTEGLIKCPCHLGIGQEAVAVGVSRFLRRSDRIFGTHRSHSHFLALGSDPDKLFGEVLGKVTGASMGMGGSMHLWDQERGFYGSVPIVGATISIAVGAGLAAKLSRGDGRDYDVGVCYFGDGATEEGTFHESMNLAATHKIPTLFVCEHNLYSSHLYIEERQPAISVARYAEAHKVNYRIVDGNDLIAVQKATAELLEETRAQGEPGFLEAVTYRWRGHVGPREDIDVGVQRKDDLSEWKKRDPIRRLARALIEAGDYSEAAWQQMDQEVVQQVADSAEKAIKADFPGAAKLYDIVYQGGAPS